MNLCHMLLIIKLLVQISILNVYPAWGNVYPKWGVITKMEFFCFAHVYLVWEGLYL
jgi:hypothetical protein